MGLLVRHHGSNNCLHNIGNFLSLILPAKGKIHGKEALVLVREETNESSRDVHGYYPYYYPPVVVERPAPPIYVEQFPTPLSPPAAAPVNYWYYCVAAKAYHPYVKDCPGGWQRVVPQPPPP